MTKNKNIDTTAGIYKDNYPIISLSSDVIFDNYKNDLFFFLKDRVWFLSANNIERENIMKRYMSIISIMDDIKILIKNKFPNLEIRHISIGGSYLFKTERSNDIDFNVIVSGSHFSYTEIYEVEEINRKISAHIKKISFMIFGEEDFLKKTKVFDTIEVEDYIHTSLCMREGLVFSIRNIPVYGYLCNNIEIDKHNLLIRIKRQLFHARLMLEDKVDLHRNTDARLAKSIGRISEAMLYLSIVFTELNLFPKNIIEKEKELSGELSRENIFLWLEKAEKHVDFLFKSI